ncbi:MAG TPA: GDP-mannose 4,6-dehydratase, partial [Candidatus Cloacimonadota bacterium]|nr:GDP-mannose 4,6-dehydratase [Candidatus Cloacimonadota bacterium]
KKTGELLCHLYYHLYGMSIVALRFFTVYGPRQRPDLAIYKFTDEIVEHHPIFVYGNGQSRRDYTYIDDIIDGVMRSISFVTKNRCYEIFNLGESQPVTLCDMIMTIENALGITAEKKTKPMQPGDVEQTYADIEKSRKYLAYDPHTDFKDGIERFIKWYLEKKK